MWDLEVPPAWPTGLLEPVCMYPLVLRLEVFVGVDRAMSDFREGRETTITAVLISAVHHASEVRLEVGKEDCG